MLIVLILKKAEKQLAKIPTPYRLQILSHIEGLKKDPLPPGSKKLKDHRHTYRVRSGNYRILYEIDKVSSRLIIYRIADRKEAYL